MTLDLRITSENASGQLTETDPNSRLAAASATTLDITALARNEVASRCYDGGSAGFYSGRAYAEGEFYLNASGISGYICCGFSSRDSSASLATVSGNAAALFLAPRSDVADINFYDILYESGVDHTGAGITSGTRPQKLTRVYYRIGFYSSIGGEFGALALEFYSDITRATLIRKYHVTRQANGTYQYYHVAQSYTSGSAINVTGDTANVTIYQPSAGIDLTPNGTTVIETDTGTGRLVVHPDCIVATALNIANSETAKHVAVDEGADFFGDYTVSGVLNVTAFANGATSVPMFAILSVTDAAADARASNDLQGVNIYWLTSTTYAPYIHQSVGGTDTVSTVGPTLNTNQPYSFVLERSGTTLTLKVWNDLVLTAFAGASQVGSTLTWTGRATTTYRYSMPVASTLNGATSRSSTFTLGGVQVQGGPPTVGYGASTSRLLSIGIAAGAKEFSYTAVNRLLNYSTSTHSKVASSDVVEMLRLLSLSEGANPNVIRTFARLRLLSSSSSTREGGASSAAVSKLLTSVTASKVSAGGTSGSLSVKVTITTIGYSGIFLKLISVRFTKANATTGILEPVTGLSPTLKIKRGTDGLSFDHNDKLFKTAAAAGANLTATMLETDPTYYPGTYNHFVQVNDFGAGENIVYQLWVQDTATGYFADGTIVFRDGVEQFGGMTVGQNTALTTVVSATDTLEASMTRVSATLTNKHVLNPTDGTVKVYDDAGTLLYTGLAYSDAAGTVLYDGTAAVHHTTRLT